MIKEIEGWLIEAGEMIKEALKSGVLKVEEKNGPSDLVTNIDKATQDFLIEKIKVYDPKARILAEEKGFDTIDNLAGRVFIIDPIDGTLNFVLEKENFCIMLAVYEDGVGQLGFIYDVMKGQLYRGEKGNGIYCNNQELPLPADKTLSEGLLGINGSMYAYNLYNAQAAVEASLGARITGCAGLEMIAMIRGNRIGYISYLAPWDYAAGCVMLEECGFNYATIQGGRLSFNGRERFIAGPPKVFAEYQKLLTKEK